MLSRMEIDEIFDLSKLIETSNVGGNNSVKKVQYLSNYYAVKNYSLHKEGRVRQIHESFALTTLHDELPDNFAKLIGVSSDGLSAIHSWVDGAHPKLNLSTVNQILTFFVDLKSVSDRSSAAKSFYAIDSLLSGSGFDGQIAERISRITLIPDFPQSTIEFICSLSSRLSLNRSSEHEETRAILSPSDFGIHNLLVRPNSDKIVCLDLEYFGWDDAHKLVLDTILHPSANWEPELASYFLNNAIKIFSLSETRLVMLWPWVCLKWALICFERAMVYSPNEVQSLKILENANRFVQQAEFNGESLHDFIIAFDA